MGKDKMDSTCLGKDLTGEERKWTLGSRDKRKPCSQPPNRRLMDFTARAIGKL